MKISALNFIKSTAFLLAATALPACAGDEKIPEPELVRADLSAGAIKKEAAPTVISAAILGKLQKSRPDLPFTTATVWLTPIASLFEVELPGAAGVLYTGADGAHFIAGDIFEVGNSGFVNYSDKAKNVDRAKMLDGMPYEELVSFSPEGKVLKEIFVFTDVDCGYCRKLHAEVPELNKLGIKVNYLAFPRNGIGSPGFKKITSVWCSEDRENAMNVVKSGGAVPLSMCESNPVVKQYDLGGSMGVNGTPAILFTDGELLPGYLPAAQLAAKLGLN